MLTWNVSQIASAPDGAVTVAIKICVHGIGRFEAGAGQSIYFRNKSLASIPAGVHPT